MITYFVCLLIVFGRASAVETSAIYDDSNFSPDTSPEKEFLRYKFGSDVVMKCNHHHIYAKEEDITWEFKHCLYKGVHCEGSEWKKLDYNRRKKKLRINNATDENVGIYRCLHSNSVLKQFTLDVVTTRYSGPPPEVVSLRSSSDSAVLPNTPLAIQCKVSSVSPPVIRWFKEGSDQNCEVKYDDHFYCPIPSSNDVFHMSGDKYLSKLNIYSLHNINSGTYVCLVLSEFGNDFKNITIEVEGGEAVEESRIVFWWLFLIPVSLVLVPVGIWLCFYRRKSNRRRLNEQQTKLIKPVVNVEVV
ncbi:hemicentin-1 [Tribolium castaneum]|uniref:hemicentin-1 n=1 Tax=Tribolium castaneum TaxID=7070 RepID=UPI0030FF278F